MRQIKFRGKRLDNGEWVIGFYREHPIYQRCGKSLDHINYFIDSVGGGSEFIKPSTVGQYWRTVNKQDLFDGDIIRVNKTIKVVSYRKDNACFCLANVCQLQYDGFFDIWQTPNAAWWDDFKKEITVLGNIHDNPELLKTE